VAAREVRSLELAIRAKLWAIVMQGGVGSDEKVAMGELRGPQALSVKLVLRGFSARCRARVLVARDMLAWSLSCCSL
jgi:hypothetical protein